MIETCVRTASAASANRMARLIRSFEGELAILGDVVHPLPDAAALQVTQRDVQHSCTSDHG